MRTTIDYGIDLGTTNSAIALQVGAKPTLIEGPTGHRTLPPLLPSGEREQVDVQQIISHVK
jgi:molecular chaperone DnaK (HSP70)